MSSGVDGRPQTIRMFWRDATKWLALDAPGGRIRASTERPVYRAGEEVVFAVQVFDELLKPQPGARVQVALAGREAFDLQSQGAGHYQGVASGLAPGTYEYEVRTAGDQAAVAVGRFVVEEYSIELGDLRADPLILGELARASGGRAYPLADWEDMLEQLAPRKRWVEKAEVLPLWGPLWPALLAIVLVGRRVVWAQAQRYDLKHRKMQKAAFLFIFWYSPRQFNRFSTHVLAESVALCPSFRTCPKARKGPKF